MLLYAKLSLKDVLTHKKIEKSFFLTSHPPSKDLITFIISFISLFVRVVPEPAIDEIPCLIYVPFKLSPASTRISLFIFLASIFFDSFAIEFANEKAPLIGSIGRSDIPDEENRNCPNCKILDNWVLILLADDH